MPGRVLGIIILALASCLSGAAHARPLTDKERLEVVEYEYDYAEATGALYGILGHCGSNSSDYSRVNLLHGQHATDVANNSLLTADEIRIELDSWERGRAATAYVKCPNGTKASRTLIKPFFDRLLRDHLAQNKILKAAGAKSK